MKFTGKNLKLVREALGLAAMEVQNQIATCPDIYAYAEDLEVLDKEKATLEKLARRIDANLKGNS